MAQRKNVSTFIIPSQTREGKGIVIARFDNPHAPNGVGIFTQKAWDKAVDAFGTALVEAINAPGVGARAANIELIERMDDTIPGYVDVETPDVDLTEEETEAVAEVSSDALPSNLPPELAELIQSLRDSGAEVNVKVIDLSDGAGAQATAKYVDSVTAASELVHPLALKIVTDAMTKAGLSHDRQAAVIAGALVKSMDPNRVPPTREEVLAQINASPLPESVKDIMRGALAQSAAAAQAMKATAKAKGDTVIKTDTK